MPFELCCVFKPCMSGTFALFASACAGAYIWAAVVVPETKGLSLEEIDAIFSSSFGRQDKERRKEVCRRVHYEDNLGSSIFRCGVKSELTK